MFLSVFLSPVCLVAEASLPLRHDTLRHELVQPARVAVLLRRRIPLLLADWRAQVSRHDVTIRHC